MRWSSAAPTEAFSSPTWAACPKADFAAAPNVDGLQKQNGDLRAFFQTDVLAPEVKDNDCSGQIDDGCGGPRPDGGRRAADRRPSGRAGR